MWEWEDAWILHAVASAGPAGDLRAVLASADHINVSVPNRAEIERAVRRLQAADLVEADGLRILPTPEARGLVELSARRMPGVRDIAPRLLLQLKRHVPFTGSESDWQLSPADWQRAYDDYFPPDRRR